MRFEAEHHFGATAEEVAAVLVDPDFYTALDLPDLSRPVVLAVPSAGGERAIGLRYEFEGQLDSLGQRLLGEHRLSWTQTLQLSDSSRGGTLEFAADAAPRRLHGSARFSLDPGSGGGTVRRLKGELVVGIIGIGPVAERRIVPGLLRRMDLEAEALDRRLA